METQVDQPAGGEATEAGDELAADEDDEMTADGEDGKKKRWKKSPKGKLPPRPQSQCKDSREAAADMLRRFFNRS